MAPKVPKKLAKSDEKPVVEKVIAKTMKRKKKNYQNYSSFLLRLLHAVVPNKNIGISRHSMTIMNNFVNDMLEKFASEAGKLVSHGKKFTMGSREIQSAVRLLLPQELAKHANIEGMKAITKYYNSQQNSKSTNS